ncbi:MAG: hypothetical protein ACJ71P_15920 [Nitrososphaeraceae archaeon]|jgi:hypothetical protein
MPFLIEYQATSITFKPHTRSLNCFYTAVVTALESAIDMVDMVKSIRNSQTFADV